MYISQLWLQCHNWGNPVYLSQLNHVWLLSRMCDCGKSMQWWKMCAKFFSALHTSVVSQSARSHHLHCWMWWHAGHSHHSHTNDSGSTVANALFHEFHCNGGIALHICRAKTVEEFVSETVYAVCRKELASLLLRANSPLETFVTFPHLSTSSLLLSALTPWFVRTTRDTHILHSIKRLSTARFFCTKTCDGVLRASKNCVDGILWRWRHLQWGSYVVRKVLGELQPAAPSATDHDRSAWWDYRAAAWMGQEWTAS